MTKRILIFLLLLLPAVAFAGITTEQKYLLNSKMGAVASKVQLGTLLDSADTVVSADITNETVLSEDVLDGTLVNADLSASAAIDSTKLAGFTHTAETLLGIEKMAVVTYSFAVDGGVQTTTSLGVTLPDNVIVTRVIEDITAHCTSAGSGATIKLVLPTDGDLSANQTCDGSNIGVASVLPSGTPVKTTAARALSVTIGTEAVTAGIARWFVYYVQSI
jgi:hypothetical protein